MTLAVVVNVPGEAVPKGRPRIGTNKKTGRGMAYTPSKTKQYEELVGWQARSAMRGDPPFDGPLAVEIDIVTTVPASWPLGRKIKARKGIIWPAGKPDLDNYVKALVDGLNGIVFVDDMQIVRMTATKQYGDRAGARITVREAGER